MRKILLYILGYLVSCSFAWAQMDSLISLGDKSMQKAQYSGGLVEVQRERGKDRVQKWEHDFGSRNDAQARRS